MAPFRTGRLCATIALGLALIPSRMLAQQSAPAATPAPADPPASRPQPGTPADNKDQQPDKRIFGVLPNYRTAAKTAEYAPINTHQKFMIAVKDSFDWPVYFVSGAFAALYQIENQNPSFGQGMKGYAHRYITSYGDQAIGNMMTEAIVPTLLHEDPRYFPMWGGGKWRRIWWAGTRVMVDRSDNGGTRFNFSEWLGNGAAAAIGNVYYPQSRGFGPTWQRTYTQVATDAFSNELKEFWPDIKRRLVKRSNNTGADAASSTSQH
ncbi:MAG: hypothetical protein ABSF98_21560 [Bryobacteraceae bacterium]|jgi:hypothetical protein